MALLQIRQHFTVLSIMAPYLDPLNQALADEFAAQPPLQDLPVKEFRAFFEKLQNPTHRIPGVTRTNFTVPFEGGVRTFVFKSDGIHERSILPVVLYLHGGAWISGT
jgi:acetyl esterase